MYKYVKWHPRKWKFQQRNLPVEYLLVLFDPITGKRIMSEIPETTKKHPTLLVDSDPEPCNEGGNAGVDIAFSLGIHTRDQEFSDDQYARVRRKIDLHLMP